MLRFTFYFLVLCFTVTQAHAFKDYKPSKDYKPNKHHSYSYVSFVNVELGPRPSFLVEDMDEGPLKSPIRPLLKWGPVL